MGSSRLEPERELAAAAAEFTKKNHLIQFSILQENQIKDLEKVDDLRSDLRTLNALSQRKEVVGAKVVDMLKQAELQKAEKRIEPRPSKGCWMEFFR